MERKTKLLSLLVASRYEVGEQQHHDVMKLYLVLASQPVVAHSKIHINENCIKFSVDKYFEKSKIKKKRRKTRRDKKIQQNGKFTPNFSLLDPSHRQFIEILVFAYIFIYLLRKKYGKKLNRIQRKIKRNTI